MFNYVTNEELKESERHQDYMRECKYETVMLRCDRLEKRIDSLNCESKSNDGKSFLTHYVPSGSSCGENIRCAQALASLHNKRCIFIFNYCDIYEVYPDGKWICERIGGGKPIYGSNSDSWVKH